MNKSRFQNVVMLDDGFGTTERLMPVLTEAHPLVHFLRLVPVLGSKNDFLPMAAKLFPLFQPNSLIVGVGLAGLFAMAVQERSNVILSAFAINPPPDGPDSPPFWKHSAERAVLYSSQYEPFKTSRPEAWSKYADLSFDVPWLSGGVQGAIYATSYLISAFMRGLDLRKEVSGLPTRSGAAGI